jgi:hypothetical protein
VSHFLLIDVVRDEKVLQIEYTCQHLYTCRASPREGRGHGFGVVGQATEAQPVQQTPPGIRGGWCVCMCVCMMSGVVPCVWGVFAALYFKLGKGINFSFSDFKF